MMKKLVLALTAVAAFTGSALAADLPARTYTKAPVMPEPVYNWTGFYIFGGVGGGVWDADQTRRERCWKRDHHQSEVGRRRLVRHSWCRL